MNPFTLFLPVCLLSLLSAPACADTSDNQIWMSGTVSGKFEGTPSLLYSFDTHARLRDEGERFGTRIYRPALGWKVSKTTELWSGYAFVDIETASSEAEEHRFFQQLNYKPGSFLGGSLSLRTRFEQRWRNTGGDTGYRLRQQVRLSHPLEDTPMSLVLSNEILFTVNDTDWGQSSGYDQNRLFGGLSYRLSEVVSLETGYMLNHVNGLREDTANHVFSLSLAARF